MSEWKLGNDGIDAHKRPLSWKRVSAGSSAVLFRNSEEEWFVSVGATIKGEADAKALADFLMAQAAVWQAKR